MINWLKNLLGIGGPHIDYLAQFEASKPFVAELKGLNRDPYFQMVDDNLRLFSVFDDLRYDRSDADLMSPAMRRHAITQLKSFGFQQTSGTVLHNKEQDVKVHIPKLHALGASPFDITRYTPKRMQDFYLLTPTQSACSLIDAYPTGEAVEKVKDLIVKHPINIDRLWDYMERKPNHRQFETALGHIRFVQREAVEAEPLRRRRALG